MKRVHRIPRWLHSLQQQVQPDTLSAHLPRWEESLWATIARQAPHRLVLRGSLYFPPAAGPTPLRTLEEQVSCLLEEPVTWSKGTHGIHLVLRDEATMAKVTALLLTPSAFSILQSGPSWSEASTPTFSLDAPFFALELPGLRGEFVLQEKVYDPAQPESELLRSLALLATVWRYPG